MGPHPSHDFAAFGCLDWSREFCRRVWECADRDDTAVTCRFEFLLSLFQAGALRIWQGLGNFLQQHADVSGRLDAVKRVLHGQVRIHDYG